jgi:hypothetical protein
VVDGPGLQVRQFVPAESGGTLEPAGQITAGFGGGRWSAASGAVAYGVAGEVTGGPAGVPESGTPA